jgi:undecaprenyl diphosphate synthase
MSSLRHVAIIMDGNGRWGLKKRNNRNFGHKKGVEIVEKIIDHCIRKNIKFLTLFTFSTENWRRPKKEINYLFSLLENFLKKKISQIHKQDVCIKFIGDKKNLKKTLLSSINHSEKLTKINKKIQVNIAFNYGSKNEILNTANILKKKKLRFTEKNFENNLFTQNIPNPEILIRTGNTQRLSNFMLWQLAYTEIFFEKKMWPDFNTNDFNRIINKYHKINRKFGNIDGK